MVQLQTVTRAFEVIDALWRHDGGGPAVLAEDLDLPVSTVHDYLQTLEKTGYVVQEDGTYQISHKFLATGARLQRRNKLYHVARYELKSLADGSSENANIGIVEDGRWVVLDMERSKASINLGTYPGMNTPLHTHAAAKVLLAHLPESERDAVIDGGLEAVTDQTITDPETLRAELAEIRERGYAVDADQQVKGMGVIAAPIVAGGTAIGSVAVVCPSGRLDDESFREEQIQKVRKSSDTIRVNYLYGAYSAVEPSRR